ncbi:hypothetical protein QBC37DRAFT_373518 [Rhypophila decipiens]|uniref:Uncharacterized protein n=1 Tax=Rhypophila decipiens TaxID=261697 RepID=A0AAN7B5Y0_9PEZI|nr:hypothetical protein QBC37DRAFT_373518 [Rhypophila decipiens]
MKRTSDQIYSFYSYLITVVALITPVPPPTPAPPLPFISLLYRPPVTTTEVTAGRGGTICRPPLLPPPRGCTKGSIKPLWREADNLSSGPGWTHGGIGKNVGRDNIHFINWSNSSAAFGGRPRLDYVYVERNGPITNFHVWRNTRSGGTKL